jgi:trimeric autotransporter adhesin
MKTLCNGRGRLFLAAAFLLLTLGSWSAAFGQLTPSDDAYVNSAKPTINLGTASTLNLQSAAETSFIRFDLSAVPAGYTGSSIAKATLKLYVNSVGTAGSFNVDYVNGAWAEKTITYNLQPAIGTTIASSVPLTTASAGKYLEIDITSAMVEWLNGAQPNDGIALVANSPLVATFDSKENTGASHPAEIDIVYAGIAGVTTANGSGLTGGGNSGTLSLALTNSCSNNQVLQWNGSSWACAAVGTGTITGVTAGADLTGGGTAGNVTLNLDTTKIPQLNAANTFTGVQTVNNQVSITSSAGNQALYALGNGTLNGIEGDTTWAVGSGVVGVNQANTGFGSGMYGATFSSTGYGVSGFGGTGVRGQGTIFSYTGAGGSFTGYTAPTNSGLSGNSGIVATGGNADPNSTNAQGGSGLSAVGGNGHFGNYGVYAQGGNSSSPHFFGFAGLFAQGGNGSVGGAGMEANGASGPDADGTGGIFFGGNSSIGGDGIDALAGSGYAGVFTGNVTVTGTLSAAFKNFKIDHPLDPANKYLVHASVESSELMNIYTGNVITDAQGEATVRLPEWFETLNTDFRYQLTVVGQFAQAIVGHKIENHQFQIRTNAPNVEVSWQITGVRQDNYAKAHPLVVEEEKETRLKGFYLHPELYGASDEKQIEWARHPETMQRMKERQAKVAASAKP